MNNSSMESKLFFYQCIGVPAILICLVSCLDKTQKQYPVKDVAAKVYANTTSDTTVYSFETTEYSMLREELAIRPYTPEEAGLSGTPNSHKENIAEFPNYTHEQSRKPLEETGGKFYLDTADRNFEKYWYNEKGQLKKYQRRNFSDMIYSECIIAYNHNNLIQEIMINNLINDEIKYRHATIRIDSNKIVTVITHNIVKISAPINISYKETGYSAMKGSDPGKYQLFDGRPYDVLFIK